jgi:hypothetical protein
MNRRQIVLLAGILVVLTAGRVAAQQTRQQVGGSDEGRFNFDPSSALFSANEFSLDVFGFGASRNRHGSSSSAWGPGIGGNYFFLQNWGLGVDTYADAWRNPYQLNFSGIFRYPINNSGLAPYGWGGFGRQWHYAPQWDTFFGAGLEFRFNTKTAVFTDLNGVFPLQTQNYALWRFGVRLAF